MKSQDKASVKKVSQTPDIQVCLAIRQQVFVEEQQVPLHEEIDGLDASSEHYLLILDQLPIGTARIRYLDASAKIERVAILGAYRGQGLGHVLMNFMLEEIQQHPLVKKAKLGAQTYAIPFYEKLGFIVCSEEYLDSGIPHKDMQLKF